MYAAAEVEALSSLKFEFRVIQVATSDFSEESKLGEGGFGPVYKVNKPVFDHLDYKFSISTYVF